jgi:hypothetical protein
MRCGGGSPVVVSQGGSFVAGLTSLIEVSLAKAEGERDEYV